MRFIIASLDLSTFSIRQTLLSFLHLPFLFLSFPTAAAQSSAFDTDSHPAAKRSSSVQRPPADQPTLESSPPALRGSLRDISVSQTPSSPIRPPSQGPVIAGSSRSSSKGDVTPQKDWLKDVYFFNNAPLFKAL